MKTAYQYIAKRNEQIEQDGLTKNERVILTPQSGNIKVKSGDTVINLCSNNYLGFCNHERIRNAAKSSYDKYGYGMSSVRFICGTMEVHKRLEAAVSKFLGTEDTILYSSCFDANGGLFETLLSDQDAVISDALNHASIIDGVRLCKAKRLRYRNNDMADLRAKLEEAKDARIRLIATDGVFSMDGTVANLKKICDLAEEYDALVMVDDSHAVGFMGEHGRGTPEYCGVTGRVDILTGTFGKALGGASGGYTSGRKEMVHLLRQASRPYLFSNTLAPAIAEGTLKALELCESTTEYRDRLFENTAYFSARIREIGLDVTDSGTPILPIMLYDEHVAVEMAKRMLGKGVYVTAFSYPVVPKGKARIRTQMSAALTKEELQYAADKFREVKEEMKI